MCGASGAGRAERGDVKTSDNTIVITGGTSGIGLATARALLEMKNTVIAIARDVEKLERAKRELPGLQGVACDVTDEAALRGAFASIAAERPFNVLINAAGISRAYRFAEADDAIAIARAEIATNLLGTIIATKLALPVLSKQPEAAIVTISSGIALAPHYAEPTHSATKAALHAFCRCLRAQLAGTSVRVIEVMPPLTDTPNTKGYHAKKASPDEVARAIVAGIGGDRPEIKIGIVKALGFLSRAAPGLAARIVTDSGQ